MTVIAGEHVVEALFARGLGLVTGVPCSHLNGLISGAIRHRDVDYWVATSEGEAVGIAVGAWLGGGSPVVFCQNSGLGNMVNPLSSLAHPCRIPFPIVCSWRGRPGVKDEPQHALMGAITLGLLGLLEIEHALLPATEAELEDRLDVAWAEMAHRQLPFCLLVDPGSMDEEPVDERPRCAAGRGRLVVLDGERRIARLEALERILGSVDDEAAIVATTGKTGRELYTLADRPQHFYQVGAMGCASAVALGLAVQTTRRVVVLDGDGAALMKLGNMATIGAAQPGNLVHVLLDNETHDTTGGQLTASGNVSFPRVALACGYRSAISCATLDDLETALAGADSEPGPHLIHARIRPGSLEPLGRPRVHPAEVARRFRSFVCAAPRAELDPAETAALSGGTPREPSVEAVS